MSEKKELVSNNEEVIVVQNEKLKITAEEDNPGVGYEIVISSEEH